LNYPGLFMCEEKASHTADRGVSLGASGHMSVKHADLYGAWL
jgi:hypothetical protein